ncbi:MAG TPA: pilus assembly protein PilM [Candidatus Bathyarchaeia archaeon]|nr:pilus assembly protein PilM [Candidatus Bathyarchaeia archaeon]
MPVTARVAAIEFEGDDVRLAVVKTGLKRPRVLEVHTVRAQYEDPQQRQEAMVQAVKGLVEGLKVRPTVYVLCLSSANSIVRTITIPFRGARRVTPAVTFELERYLAIPIEELVVDHMPILEFDGQTEVLAVGVRRNILQEQIDILDAAGIDPEGADIDAIGLTSLWKRVRQVKGLHALLYLHNKMAVFAIVYNKSLAYFRHLPIGAEQFAENLDDAIQEVKNSMRAFHSGWKTDGEIAALDVVGLPAQHEEALAAQFEIPVTFQDPLAAIPAPKNVDKRLCAGLIGVAAGAAGAAFSLHLRKDELAHKNLFPALVPYIMLTSCIALVLLVGFAWFYHHAGIVNAGKAAQLEQQIGSVEAEVKSLETQGINVPAGMFADPTVLDVLMEIALNLPSQVVDVTDVKIEPPNAAAPWIIVVGEVKDDNAFKAAVEKIKQSPVFKTEEPELRLVEGRSTFRLVLQRPNAGSESGEETRS